MPAAQQMLAGLLAAAKGDVTAVNGLALDHPDFAACAATASGALALPLSAGTGDAILWFRPEQVRTVSWGGNPAEHAILDPVTGGLNPRNSFAEWKETVRGRAVPWAEADLALAREFRNAFAVAVARRVQNELIRLRDYDPLTGLPKWDLLPQWIGQPGRYSEASVALLIIDLGALKEVEDDFGKDEANALLVELARRLMHFVGPDSLVARHGETEFVVLYLGAGQSEVEARATEIRQAMEHPYLIRGQPYRIRPSFRFAFADDTASLDLAGAADIAMATAKAAGAFKRKVETQRQKMEGLGRMMGGIAHEINNMLQPVTLLGQDLLDHDLVKDEARDTIGIILDCSRQARQIIGDLLAFSRPRGRSTERLDPVDLLQDTLRLVRQAIPHGVKVTTDVHPGMPDICVNRTTFAQVLLNLATNAAAAMEGNGVITITLSETANNAADLQPGAPRRFIRLCVTDTGCGMDKETLDRAFEPFFTTKQVGQGTGLGLSVVFSLVEEMAGSITLASEVGVGTTVTVLLPGAGREG
jgi:diguanylate cyclase (GGDEF)-like protein